MQFERYLATPYSGRAFTIFDPVSLPATHERLGRLYDAKGNKPKAIEHYRALVELWKNADQPLQPRVAKARKRIAELTQ